MKYFLQTFKYLKNKNKFWKLLFLSVAPAAVLSFAMPVPNFNALLFDFFDGILASESIFPVIFGYMTGLTAAKAALSTVTAPFAAVVISYISSIIERDMHVGDFRYVPFARNVNNNFYPYFVFIFFSLLGAEFLLLTGALFVNLWIAVFAGAEIMAFIFTVITLILIFSTVTALFSLVIIWPALMINTGMKPLAALAHILRMKGSRKAVIIAVLIPAAAFEAAYALCFLLSAGAAVYGILGAVFFAVTGVYLPTLINTAYYDIAGLNREDLNGLNIWTK
ncbi:MAG: hypothetical protein LBP79_00110 [Clostridiales bacterium]|jgi:hypothetical protein|nr:hypothetical protein [Clostridiales bacterium]